MISPFLLNYDKSNLFNDISEYISNMITNVNNDLLKKKYNNISWFLVESINLISQYDYYYPDMNLLEDNEYQNIINAIQKILNKEYYGFNK